VEYEIIPSTFFLEQINDLSDDAKKLIGEKLELAKINPYRFKRIEGYKLFLFRIRFEDERKEKRVVYLVDKPRVKVLCILDRSGEYKQLRKFLKRQEIL
jgi:mRNA-degrading endonuclease RelE of RelBE toxin-antitoxin system|tara:strand:- start:1095 stop:1391 length:297 start_codon:yes stop_codon:yes gene_type:complete